MPRSYTKMEEIAAAVFARKTAGETNKQIGITYNKFRKKKKGSKRHGPKSLVE